VLGLGMALGISTSSLAQAVPADDAGRRGIELGIIVNQTFNATGQEFYRRFTDFWREKPDFERYTLVVLAMFRWSRTLGPAGAGWPITWEIRWSFFGRAA
jgi:hypothetical protein